jgi:hypothetical protein
MGADDAGLVVVVFEKTRHTAIVCPGIERQEPGG